MQAIIFKHKQYLLYMYIYVYALNSNLVTLVDQLAKTQTHFLVHRNIC